MRRGTRTIAIAATMAVALTTGIGSAAAAATSTTTSTTTSATRLALQRAGVSPGVPGVNLPDRGSTVRAGDLTIRYPQASATGQSVDDHTTVFEGRHFDQVVQSTGQDDVRLLTVLTDRSAPTTYDYAFTGHELRELGEGYLGVFDAGSGEPVALIEPAWAKDAHGRPVATHYEIDGSTLTQVVDVTKRTAFPVVADPSVKKHWWGQDIKFSKSETERLLAGGTACSIVPYIGAACRLLMAWAASGWAMHKCLAVKDPLVGPTVPWYWSCKW
jgi:hypothetical protein